MFRKSSALLVAGTLSASLATGAFASGPHDADTGPVTHKASPAPADARGGPPQNTVRGQHLGSPASAQDADRRVKLQPGDRSLNVTRGETVLIEAGGQSFAWKFDTLGSPVFLLSEIAPNRADVQGVRVYVTQNRREVAD